MSIIVTGLKKNKKKYVVSLSNGKELITNEDLILKYRLVVNHVIDDEELDKIKSDIIFFDYYAKALSYISKAVHSKGQIYSYLIKKECSHEMALNILDTLNAKNLVDDKLYLDIMFLHYMDNGYGPYYLKAKALEAKVDNTLINKTLDNISDDIFKFYASKLVKKMLKSYAKYDENKRIFKIKAYLFQRGYSQALINEVLNNYEF